jgi:hypothetical protein
VRIGVGAVSAAAITVSSSACLDFGDKPMLDFGRDCAVDSDCADYAPAFDVFFDRACNVGSCEDRRCTTRARTGYLPDERRGDCYRTKCTVDSQGAGQSKPEADDSDTPEEEKECWVGACSDGMSMHVFAAEGTACSTGVCHAGNCVPASDAGESDAGTDGGQDAGDSDGG